MAEDPVAAEKLLVGPSGGESGGADPDRFKDAASPQLLEMPGVVIIKFRSGSPTFSRMT